ncbi:hypothetical protein NQ707_01195 [Rothia sp. BD8]|uniref:hypothetical protein n=1 Tax=Rothia sp. BD8 TaxID=2953894 RepID=UPI0038470703
MRSMNYVLVGLTLIVMAVVIISCAVLGTDRISAAERLSEDGLDTPGAARGPLER